jgi:superfamily II DNA/RNA helicase
MFSICTNRNRKNSRFYITYSANIITRSTIDKRRALILTPTRELAAQILANIKEYSEF